MKICLIIGMIEGFLPLNPLFYAKNLRFHKIMSEGSFALAVLAARARGGLGPGERR
jgi:hypothetical protein